MSTAVFPLKDLPLDLLDSILFHLAFLCPSSHRLLCQLCRTDTDPTAQYIAAGGPVVIDTFTRRQCRWYYDAVLYARVPFRLPSIESLSLSDIDNLSDSLTGRT
jgi:hypothetical protein